jgi:plasmid maintenance system antidote protein VapI
MKKDITKDESFFAVFCIESLAEELGIPGNEVYDLLAEKSDILDNYIIECYDTLHTQGKEWLVDDLIDMMKRRGVG